MRFPGYIILGSGAILATTGWLSGGKYKTSLYVAAVGVPVLLWAIDKADRNARLLTSDKQGTSAKPDGAVSVSPAASPAPAFPATTPTTRDSSSWEQYWRQWWAWMYGGGATRVVSGEVFTDLGPEDFN